MSLTNFLALNSNFSEKGLIELGEHLSSINKVVENFEFRSAFSPVRDHAEFNEATLLVYQTCEEIRKILQQRDESLTLYMEMSNHTERYEQFMQISQRLLDVYYNIGQDNQASFKHTLLFG